MKKIIFLMVLITAMPSAYAQRYALVIGNGDYTGDIGRLTNPVNDATDMADMLKRKDFSVTVLKNATKRQMKQGISQFTRQLNQKNAVGLFFFAGHGVEVTGRNYLIPVNANIQDEADVEFESIDAGRVMKGMEFAGNDLNMVILDACRNNPFARSFRSANRGLARMTPPKGSLILYATSPGEVAADGHGRNGLFTQYLLRAIDQPNLTVERAFKSTAIGVYKATAKKQLPWQQGVILGDFYFSRSHDTVPPPVKPYVPPVIKMAHLSVKTSPENARVRILNIGPKYYDGIELKPGRYHIEVSYKGYQRHTEWINLAAEDKQHNVVLAANERPVTPAMAQAPSAMVNIKGGCYQMGSPDWETDRDDDEKRHQVCVNNFQMGKKEVTVGEFRKFVRATGYRTQAEQNVKQKGCYAYSGSENKWVWRAGHYWDNVGFSQDDQHPVVCVSWIDVQNYIGWLNENSAGGYRLPTEAEWEYAARAGTQTAYFWGSAVDDRACRYANVADKAHNWSAFFPCDDGVKFTNTVASYRPNAFGLYDMSGNVWEWTCSKYQSKYGGEEKKCKSKNHANNSDELVLRGGSFDSGPRWLRVAYRGGDRPWGRYDYWGFRLARTR